METVADVIFMSSKIIADGECNHKIKRQLLLGRKVMTNLNSMLKSRDVTLPKKVCQVKAVEKEMETHSSIFAWRISGTEVPDGLPSTGSHRVGHD